MAFDTIWEDIFSSREWGKYPAEELIRFVARNFYRVEDRSAVKILEVGCGPGANLWFCAREGFSTYGVDGSVSAITTAQTRLDRECPGWKGKLGMGDITRLEFPDGMFDAVIDNEAIYANSFEDSLIICSEIRRVLKPAGMFFSRTFAEGSWGDGTGEKLAEDAWRCAEGPLDGKGYSRFTREASIPVLLKGFNILECELLTVTYERQRKAVKEWLITARKS